MSILSKIQSLITAANAKTGESDATLTDAVQTLVDGYGQGGGSGSGLSVLASGTYTLAEGTKTLQIPVTAPITGTPKEAYIYRDDTITGTESLAAFVLLDAPTEVTYDGKYFKGNAGFVDRYGTATISNPPTKTILSTAGSNGFSDGVLSATTSGANFKAGRYAWAIYGEASGGGGSSITVEPLTVTQNGTQTAPSGKAYSPVTVNVPNSYSGSDLAKVVKNINGVYQLTEQTSYGEVTNNGRIYTTYNNSVIVNVQPTQVYASDWRTMLSNPFSELDFDSLYNDIQFYRLPGYLCFTFNDMPVQVELYARNNCIGGMAFITSPDVIGFVGEWDENGVVSLDALMSGQVQDMRAYAPQITCYVGLYGTTAPTPAT